MQTLVAGETLMDLAAYAAILDAIAEGVVIFGRDRKIIYCNQPFMDMSGYDRSDMAGALCGIMQGPDTDPDTIRAIDEALTTGAPFSGEILNYRKSGEPFWNQLRFTPQHSKDGSLTHFIGVSRDITQRKTAEARATKLENDYRFIFENVLSGVILHGADTRIRVANRRAAELLGLDADILAGAPLADERWVLLREDGTQMPLEEYPVSRAIAEQTPIRGVLQGYRRPSDGKLLWFVCNALPVFDENDAVTEVLVSFSDVTRLIESEAEAKTFQERFELAARATQDVIFEWDIESGKYWANDAFKSVYGFDPPPYITLDALEGISAVEADRDLVRAVTLDAISRGKERYSVNYDVTRADGTTGHVSVRAFIKRDQNGKALRIIGTGTDIGRLTDAIKALEQSEARFRLIADTASDVVWDHDFDTKQSWITPNWPLKLGIDLDASISQESKWFDYLDAADRERMLRSFENVLKSDASKWEIEYKLRGSDGQKIDVAVKAAILRHPDGRAARMLGNVRNITKEKRHQEGYTRARALEAVGQLTGGIAHDFNNLLMIIQGNAELLEGIPLADEDAESVALISRAAESAAALTQRLLSFAGQTQMQTASIDLKSLIPNTAALLRSGLPEYIALNFDIAEDVWDPDVDANALEQAIVNLAVNAMDAMPSGGEITLRCENREIGVDERSSDFDVAPGRYVLVAVRDTGEGMPPDVLSRVFEPFFTTKDVGKGTGLGLSMVYGFIKKSGGEVTIESEPGSGTIVNLYLPVGVQCFADNFEVSDGVEHPSDDQTDKKRVLVVEDEPDVRAHVEKTLKRFGYHVETAPDALSALTLMREGRRYDLLFTDIIMPGRMNGQELAEAAEALDPQMKVLYTSGYPAAAFEHLGLKEQSNIHLLRKPYKAIDLKEVLIRILHR